MSADTATKRRAILLFVYNRPGVLNKISMLIRRKMFNVETITACRSIRPGITRITLTLLEDRDDKLEQVIKQIEKVTEVVSAKELDPDTSFWREVAILKVEAELSQLEKLGRTYDLEILDRRNHELFIVQVAGTTRRIDEFMEALGVKNIIEIARSGVTALEI